MKRMSLEEATEILLNEGITVEKNKEFDVNNVTSKETSYRYFLKDAAAGIVKGFETAFEVLQLAKWVRSLEFSCEGLSILDYDNYEKEWQASHDYAKDPFKAESYKTRSYHRGQHGHYLNTEE